MINIPNNIDQMKKEIYKLAYTMCSKKVHNGTPLEGAIKETCDAMSQFISEPELAPFLRAEVTAYSEPSIGILSEEVRHEKWWDELRKNSDFRPEYSTRYYNYMCQKPGWSVKSVDDISDSTNKVLNALSNPCKNEAKERMGLVFGYVQSGKTAHYIDVINKAYDAGYKIIIVLSGIHNSLRSQTQSRIDEEVLGYETSAEYILNTQMEKNQIGVGIGGENRITGILLQSLTSRDEKGDISKKTNDVSMTPPYVVVTKKVASVLRNLITYFKKTPIASVRDGKKYIPATYPVLIIDDEADQASVNTKATRDKDGNYLDEYNPSTINGLIRTLFMMFDCRSYVGYTATPFANIFIDPKTPDNQFGSDLFPRDFIFRAPRSGMYIGAREFFGMGDNDGETTPTMPLFRPVVSGADYLGKGTKSDDPIGPIPDEMKTAIKYFVISTAVRNLRGQRNKPNTMLIHIIRFVAQQNKLKKKVKDFYEELEAEIRYGDTETRDSFYKLWTEDYLKTTANMRQPFEKYMSDCINVTWEAVWAEIVRLAREKEIKVYSVNGKSEDSLMYKEHQGMPFNVIVIGGDKLSRGLTLEGLTVSYFTRSSGTYDTLMQMGRWFGYRPGYIDVCRLFTTRNLYKLFSHISMATENLAEQFEYMDEVDQTPSEFGLRVLTHPDLLITSRNKLRTGDEFFRDFSCKLSQTRVFDVDGDAVDHNFEAVELLLKSIGNPIGPENYREEFGRKQPGQHLFWRHVPSHSVASFFENYETSASASRASSHLMAEYVRDLSKVGGLTDWTVCLMNVTQDSHSSFKIAGYEIGAGIFREEGRGVNSEAGSSVSIHTMTSAGHEYYDYTQEQLDKKDALAVQLKAEGKRGINERLRKVTRPFTKGLLLLYPIADAGALTRELTEHKTPFGFAVVFPDRQSKGNLKPYRLNEIALEKDSDELYN